MNGIINVLKPPGMTSHDVVSFIRKVSGIKKVGHTGTLDPGAAGVLPVCIGKSTKIVDYIMSDTKTYICELMLGNESDTYDKYGKFKYENNIDFPNVSPEDFEIILNNYKGNISQKPPAYSAIKLEGKKAYELARQGKDVDIPKRNVTIYSIDVLKYELPGIMLKIVCSKGTYIRSICNDIGADMGCGAYMNFLIRTATGNFKLENSYMLHEITTENIQKLLIPTDYALEMESVTIPEKYKNNALNGNSINIESTSNTSCDEPVKIYISNYGFIGIGKVKNNCLRIEKILV